MAFGLACGCSYAAESLTSLRNAALVTIGGEVMTDLSWRRDSAEGIARALELRRANLRIVADAHPNVRAFFKLDLSDDGDRFRDAGILEEAMLVVGSLGGTGLDVFAGQGRAPYGQNITLGMIQSYHHHADHVDSSEGRIHIIDAPGVEIGGPGGRTGVVSEPRPGQIDRVVMAGASYEWDERWRVEAAVFDPDDSYRSLWRRAASSRIDGGNDVGLAARAWWRPFEELTLTASAAHLRTSALDGLPVAGRAAAVSATDDAWSVSLGFDWRSGPYRVFGEFQRAWDWGFVKGHDVTVAQLGASREFLGSWRLGAMAEHMRVGGPLNDGARDRYWKLVLNLRYSFSGGAFVMLEYGHEAMRRTGNAGTATKRRGDLIGMRLGLLF